MITITKERVAGIARGEKCYTHDDVVELAHIALASLEAEPVAWRYRYVHTPKTEEHGSPFTTEWKLCDSEDECNPSDCFERQPLYAAPPAPVSVPDFGALTKCIVQRLVDYGAADDDAIAIAEEFVYNACRAAMLQGAKPVTTAYKLPANMSCKEAPEHIWLQTAGVWPENGEFSELTWCSDNQHPDDTLYVRADVVTGNSPVIPDGWVACSERMPDKLIPVMVMYADGEMWSAIWTGTKWDDGTELPDPHAVTHWQEMPAAPQQEA